MLLALFQSFHVSNAASKNLFFPAYFLHETDLNSDKELQSVHLQVKILKVEGKLVTVLLESVTCSVSKLQNADIYETETGTTYSHKYF